MEEHKISFWTYKDRTDIVKNKIIYMAVKLVKWLKENDK